MTVFHNAMDIKPCVVVHLHKFQCLYWIYELLYNMIFNIFCLTEIILIVFYVPLIFLLL